MTYNQGHEMHAEFLRRPHPIHPHFAPSSSSSLDRPTEWQHVNYIKTYALQVKCNQLFTACRIQRDSSITYRYSKCLLDCIHFIEPCALAILEGHYGKLFAYYRLSVPSYIASFCIILYSIVSRTVYFLLRNFSLIPLLFPYFHLYNTDIANVE